MGIDTCIDFRIREGCQAPDLWLPDGLKILAAPEWCAEGATHEVDNGWRYYGDGYERGPWPLIAGVLMMLLAHEAVGTVWYYGDCHESPNAPFTLADLFDLTAHYVANGERPYRTGSERVKAEWPQRKG